MSWKKGCRYRYCDSPIEAPLLRFPNASNRDRQILWIENAGNKWLRNLASSTLSSHGLCEKHFAEEDLIPAGGNRKRLRPKANPLHWESESQQELIRIAQKKKEERALEAISEVPEEAVAGFQVADEQVEADSLRVFRSDAPKTYSSGKDLLSISEPQDSDISYMNSDPQPPPVSEKVTDQEPPDSSEKSSDDQILKEQQYVKAYRKLKNTIVRLQAQRRGLQKKLKICRKEKKLAKQRAARAESKLQKEKSEKVNTIDDFLKSKNLSPSAETLVRLQFREKRVPYTPAERKLAKQIYFYSASTYNFLRSKEVILPSPSSVRDWVAEYDILPGLNPAVLEIIKKNLAKLPPEQRVCALKFDEMSIRALYEYSLKHDRVEGCTDMGFGTRSGGFAKHMILFNLDSINAENPWRQLLAYGFNENGATGEQLVRIITHVLRELRKIGADVRLMVCDQGQHNQNLYKLLGVTEECPFFYIDGVRYYALYDWPHLIKRLLSQLRSHGYIQDIDGQILLHFNDLLHTWQVDMSLDTSNQLSQLSMNHFDPNNFDVMKVGLAFQLVSRKVASAMETAGKAGLLNSGTWERSAITIRMLDAVIDAMNSYNLLTQNKQKRPLSRNNPEIKSRLESFLENVVGWRVGIGEKRPPCIKGLQQTVRAELLLFADLDAQWPGFALATGLTNQDSVEHTFAKYRRRGGNDPNPSSRKCRLTTRHIICTEDIEGSKVENTNCGDAPSLIQADDGEGIGGFSTTESLFFSVPESHGEEMQDLLEILDAARMMETFEPIDSSSLPEFDFANLYEQNSVIYLAGYVARRTLKHQKTKCERCIAFWVKGMAEPNKENELYTRLREYSHDDLGAKQPAASITEDQPQPPENILHPRKALETSPLEKIPEVIFLLRPTEIFAKIVYCQLKAYSSLHSSVFFQTKLLATLTEQVEEFTNQRYPEWFKKDHPCYAHRMEALKSLLLVKIHATCRIRNYARMYGSKSVAPKKRKATEAAGNTTSTKKRRKLKNLQNI